MQSSLVDTIIPGRYQCPWKISLSLVVPEFPHYWWLWRTLVFLKEPSVLTDPGVLGGSRCLWRTQVSLVDSCVPAGPHLPYCILVSLMDPRVLGESKCPRGNPYIPGEPSFPWWIQGSFGNPGVLGGFRCPIIPRVPQIFGDPNPKFNPNPIFNLKP